MSRSYGLLVRSHLLLLFAHNYNLMSSIFQRLYSQKVIPRFHKYGQLKLNFKEIVS